MDGLQSGLAAEVGLVGIEGAPEGAGQARQLRQHFSQGRCRRMSAGNNGGDRRRWGRWKIGAVGGRGVGAEWEAWAASRGCGFRCGRVGSDSGSVESIFRPLVQRVEFIWVRTNASRRALVLELEGVQAKCRAMSVIYIKK